ncbi:MAG: hypothetical protein JRJ27_20375 [Deltaproteobacteria bacterium]|nr:hypothetical protein [Deltaproteobacteria bacterium]
MQVRIRHNYTTALTSWERFSKDQRRIVQKLAADLYAIKKETEQTAIALGYSHACRTSIEICRGECCRWHFPKTFNEGDFLAIIGSLTEAERDDLSHRILGSDSQSGQCILLMPDGCFLSFRSRPMVCTNAYPCFASRAYWEIKEAGNHRSKPFFKDLSNLILTSGQHQTGYSQ